MHQRDRQLVHCGCMVVLAGQFMALGEGNSAKDDFISRYKSPGEDASHTVDVRASLVGDVEGEESV